MILQHLLFIILIVSFSRGTVSLKCHCTNRNFVLPESVTECDNHFCSIGAASCNASHSFPACASLVKVNPATIEMMEQSCVCKSLEEINNVTIVFRANAKCQRKTVAKPLPDIHTVEAP